MIDVAHRLRSLLKLAHPAPVGCEWAHVTQRDGFTHSQLEYQGLEGDPITADLLMPDGDQPVGAVVMFHQHNGEFHLGKSEVMGLAGDPLQAFGPALASRGVAVLAADALTFEDRREGVRGVEPDEGDWLQHYNAMAYRLVNGDVLMRKCLDDAQRALSVLLAQPRVDPERTGVFGHSYGGTTALYHGALDGRSAFVGVSGALASLRERQRRGTGINMFEVVPGLAEELDAHDLVRAISPRPLLVVSATEDPYSVDADRITDQASGDGVTAIRVEGPHALGRDRFDAIIEWLLEQANRIP